MAANKSTRELMNLLERRVLRFMPAGRGADRAVLLFLIERAAMLDTLPVKVSYSEIANGIIWEEEGECVLCGVGITPRAAISVVDRLIARGFITKRTIKAGRDVNERNAYNIRRRQIQRFTENEIEKREEAFEMGRKNRLRVVKKDAKRSEVTSQGVVNKLHTDLPEDLPEETPEDSAPGAVLRSVVKKVSTKSRKGIDERDRSKANSPTLAAVVSVWSKAHAVYGLQPIAITGAEYKIWKGNRSRYGGDFNDIIPWAVDNWAVLLKKHFSWMNGWAETPRFVLLAKNWRSVLALFNGESMDAMRFQEETSEAEPTESPESIKIRSLEKALEKQKKATLRAQTGVGAETEQDRRARVAKQKRANTPAARTKRSKTRKERLAREAEEFYKATKAELPEWK